MPYQSTTSTWGPPCVTCMVSPFPPSWSNAPGITPQIPSWNPNLSRPILVHGLQYHRLCLSPPCPLLIQHQTPCCSSCHQQPYLYLFFTCPNLSPLLVSTPSTTCPPHIGHCFSSVVWDGKVMLSFLMWDLGSCTKRISHLDVLSLSNNDRLYNCYANPIFLHQPKVSQFEYSPSFLSLNLF